MADDDQVRRDQELRDAALAREQTEAAAQDAGSVGGRAPEGGDPARRPVEEAGGGESEGFEAAEDALIEQASHGDPASSPTQDAFTPEVESDLSGAEDGEADSGKPEDL